MRIIGGKVGINTTSPYGAGTKLQVNSASHSQIAAHFGQGQNNSSGVFGGISLGYTEANDNYRKVAIVAKALADGAARQNLNFLVDTASDGGSAGVADTKMMIDGITGYVGIGNVAPATRLSNTGTRIGNADGLTTNFIRNKLGSRWSRICCCKFLILKMLQIITLQVY